ncbi:hypothetical protein FKP32DRAFT_917807 [Trametes sanguinea]|nr:hypothetical protein FKP32DRAFT_917807 [Trametes sanguinea]
MVGIQHSANVETCDTPDSSLVLAPQAEVSGAILVAALPGDGSSDDITALYPLNGSGVPTPIVHNGLCITSKGVVPESSSQILYVAECDSSDPAQYWTINANPPTISNVDGNCITLGRAANGVSVCSKLFLPRQSTHTICTTLKVVLDFCNDELQHLQLWDPKPISA